MPLLARVSQMLVLLFTCSSVIGTSRCPFEPMGTIWATSTKWPFLPKPDLLFLLRRLGRGHQLADDFEDDGELFIVFILQLIQPLGEIFVSNHQFAHLDKGSHDHDIHLRGPLTSQHTRKHSDTLLSEGAGMISQTAPT